MVKKKLFRVAACTFGLLCISVNQYSPKSIAAEPPEDISGWWILHEYHDRIMNNRCIGEFSFEEPVFSSILIKVTADSVFSFGSIFPGRATPILQGDTITIIDGMHVKLPLFSSNKKNELLLILTDDSAVVHTYHYRRMSNTERASLTNDLDDRSKRWQLDRNYQDFFQEQFFTGTFTELNGESFTINKKDQVKGFRQWNTCSVDNFFGTTHWLGKRDRVRFEDSTNTRNFQDYNWRYRGDTLVLRKFVGPDIEQYKLSREEFRYIRTP